MDAPDKLIKYHQLARPENRSSLIVDGQVLFGLTHIPLLPLAYAERHIAKRAKEA